MTKTWMLGALALALTGCAEDTLDEGWFPGCDETRTELGDDEASALGFSADDVFAELTLPATLDGRIDGDVAVTVTLDLIRTDDPVAFVDREPSEPPDDVEEIPTIDVQCDDTLEIPVQLTLTTDDGSFDETVTAELEAATPGGVALFADLGDGQALDGTYQPGTVDTSEYDTWGYTVDLRRDAGTWSGAISLVGEGTDGDGDVAFVEQTEVLTWSDDG